MMQIASHRNILPVRTCIQQSECQVLLNRNGLVMFRQELLPLMRECASPPHTLVPSLAERLSEHACSHLPAASLNGKVLTVFDKPDQHRCDFFAQGGGNISSAMAIRVLLWSEKGLAHYTSQCHSDNRCFTGTPVRIRRFPASTARCSPSFTSHTTLQPLVWRRQNEYALPCKQLHTRQP